VAKFLSVCHILGKFTNDISCFKISSTILYIHMSLHLVVNMFPFQKKRSLSSMTKINKVSF
jgi:hypothetical protein